MNPLLPARFSPGSGSGGPGLPPTMFAWAQERLRVLSADSPAAAMREYRVLAESEGGQLTESERYGLALAQMRAGYPAAAESALATLVGEHPDNLLHRPGPGRERLRRAQPGLVAPALRRPAAQVSPGPRGQPELCPEAQRNRHARWRPPRPGRAASRCCRPAATTPCSRRTSAAPANWPATCRAPREAYAEAAYLNGRAEDALSQLTGLLEARRPRLLSSGPASKPASPRSPRWCWTCAARA